MNRKIPNVFHFIFGLKKQKEPFHLAYFLCLESCRQVNAPDCIYFYYHYEPYGKYWDLVKDKLVLVKIDPDRFIAEYRYEDKGIAKYSYAHHSDFIRLRKLIDQGGVYADIDTIFVNRIRESLFAESFVLGRENDIFCQQDRKLKRSLCNAFIMSEKDSEFGGRWLARMMEAFDGTWSNHSTVLPQEISEECPHLIHIEPPRSFYPYMWTPAGIDTLFKGCDHDYKGIMSIHLWSHLWWEKKRRDFSDFHAGLLTEDFIRKKDTTYNLIARRYLPRKSPSLSRVLARW